MTSNPEEIWASQIGVAAEGTDKRDCKSRFFVSRGIHRILRYVMQTISLRLPDEMLVHLDAEAKARGMTRSSLVRESLEKALRKESSGGAVSCYDRARDLAGTVKGLPEDLAGNPKYMEGFRFPACKSHPSGMEG